MSNLTLFDLTYRVAREVTNVLEGVATGGSATTIVDNPIRDEANSYWQLGTAWIIRDAGGAGAAPEKEYSVISDSTAASYTVTLRSTLTAAVASGDRYAICRKIGENPWLDVIIQKINQALIEIGPVPTTDTTTITTALNQTEYSLPIGAGQDLREVWLQTQTGDANDNRYQRLYHWRVQQGAAGASDTIIFGTQLPSGYTVKLAYLAPHAEMYTATADLNERVPQELVIYPAIRDCLLFLKEQTGNDKWDEKIKYWSDRVELAKDRSRIPLPHKSSKLMIPQPRYAPDPTFDGTVRVNWWD